MDSQKHKEYSSHKYRNRSRERDRSEESPVRRRSVYSPDASPRHYRSRPQGSRRRYDDDDDEKRHFSRFNFRAQSPPFHRRHSNQRYQHRETSNESYRPRYNNDRPRHSGPRSEFQSRYSTYSNSGSLAQVTPRQSFAEESQSYVPTPSYLPPPTPHYVSSTAPQQLSHTVPNNIQNSQIPNPEHNLPNNIDNHVYNNHPAIVQARDVRENDQPAQSRNPRRDEREPDEDVVEKILTEMKAQGIVDKFRSEFMTNVDSKPTFSNLKNGVEKTVKSHLATLNWYLAMNRNMERDILRKRILGDSLTTPPPLRRSNRIRKPNQPFTFDTVQTRTIKKVQPKTKKARPQKSVPAPGQLILSGRFVDATTMEYVQFNLEGPIILKMSTPKTLRNLKPTSAQNLLNSDNAGRNGQNVTEAGGTATTKTISGCRGYAIKTASNTAQPSCHRKKTTPKASTSSNLFSNFWTNWNRLCDPNPMA